MDKKKWSTKDLLITAFFLAITLLIQFLRMPPPITGPLINLMLILTTYTLGVKKGILLGLLTPWGGFLLGILPPILGPIIPFIMLGNGLYCLIFFYLQQVMKGWLGILGGSLVKYIIIAGASGLLLELPPTAMAALGFPQLITALIGGSGALLIRGSMERFKEK